jgi:hypothetical protein
MHESCASVTLAQSCPHWLLSELHFEAAAAQRELQLAAGADEPLLPELEPLLLVPVDEELHAAATTAAAKVRPRVKRGRIEAFMTLASAQCVPRAFARNFPCARRWHRPPWMAADPASSPSSGRALRILRNHAANGPS